MSSTHLFPGGQNSKDKIIALPFSMELMTLQILQVFKFTDYVVSLFLLLFTQPNTVF